MVILGIDPGTATTGFGVIKNKTDKPGSFDLLAFGTIDTAKNQSPAQRLLMLFDDLNILISKYRPDRIGIEKLFFTTNQKTAMAVSQARGVALLACQKHGLPILEFTPLQIKSSLCGYGKADKRQVQYMVQKTFNLKSPPKPDDAADALAVALCAAWTKFLIPAKLPTILPKKQAQKH